MSVDTELAVVLLIIFAGAVVYAVSGFGFGLLVIPALGVFVGAHEAIMTSVVLMVPLGMMVVWKDRRYIVWRHVVQTLLFAAFGFPIGLAIFTRIQPAALNLIVGLGIITVVLMEAFKVSLPSGQVSIRMAGFMVGVLTTTTGMNGPPAVAAFQRLELDTRSFRGSVGFVFLTANLLASGSYALSGLIETEVLCLILLSLPAIALGFAAGDRIFSRHLKTRAARHLVLSLLVASGLLALGQAGRSLL